MENELTHHGIVGMKWGVRRYQNKDGSLTPAGRKKLGYAPADKKGLFGHKKKSVTKSSDDKPIEKPKKISEMSDSELKERVNRLNLEKQAYDLQKQIATLNPKQVSSAQKFIKGLANDVLLPTAKNIGKDYLDKMLREKLGLNKKQTDVYGETSKEVKNWATQKAYNKMKEEQKQEADRIKFEKQAANAAAKAAKVEKQAAAAAERNAKRTAREAERWAKKDAKARYEHDRLNNFVENYGIRSFTPSATLRRDGEAYARHLTENEDAVFAAMERMRRKYDD